MKTIVTGCAGFVGSTLSEALLARGDEVHGIDCFTDYYARAIKERNLRHLRQQKAFRLSEINLMEVNWDDILSGVDVVYHQAAQAGVRSSWGKDFWMYTDWNILATQQLLEAIRRLPEEKRPRLVYASTSSVYGERDVFPFRETDRCEPVSPYGVSKLAGENLCMLYSHNFGLETVSLRYFTVYGPRQRPDMAFHKFIRAVFKGEPIPLFGDGEQTRDFTFVEDIVAANLAAAEHGTQGRIYNIGGGSRVTVNHTLEVLRKVMDMEVKVDRQPRQYGDMSHTAADTERARTELKWNPRVGLEEGLRAEKQYVKNLMQEGL